MGQYNPLRSRNEGSEDSEIPPVEPARDGEQSVKSSPAWHLNPIALTAGCGIILLASIAIGTAMMILQFRERAVARAERELTNTALLLAKHLDAEFEELERVQRDIAARIHAAGITSNVEFVRQLSGHDVHLMLKDKIDALPHIAGVGLVSPDGRLINSSRNWPLSSVSVADRAFFISLRSDPRATTFVNEPLYNRADGAFSIVIARRVNAPNGEFLGLVLGSIEPQYFQNFFGSLELDKHGTISLFRDDGMMLARYPEIPSTIGKIYRGFIDTLAGSEVQTTRVVASTDGLDRLLAAKRLGHFPLVIAVGVEATTALADWREQTRFLLGVAGLSATVIAVLFFIIVRRMRKEHNLSEQRIALEKRRLDTATDNMSQGLLMFDASGQIVVVNQRYIEMFGASPDVVKPGCMFHELLVHRHETGSFLGDVDEYAASILADLAQGKATEHYADTPDGRFIKIVNNPMAGGGWVATLEDITRQRDAERERDRNRDFLNLIIDNIPTTIAVKDARSRRYVLINHAAEKSFGASRDQVIGKMASDIFPKAAADLIAQQDEQQLRSEGQVFFDEHTVYSEFTGTRIITSNRVTIFDSKREPQYLVSVIEDVTERNRANARIAHLAQHDVLTDLPNRLLFREQLEQALRLTRKGEHVAVLYCDLDNFKDVNDTLGHPAGDALLQAVAMRLRDCISEGDTVARLGGDEFAIIQTAVKQPSDVTDLVRRIYDVIRKPIHSGNYQFSADASFGIAMAPEDGTDPDQLLKNADMALYGAKSDGRSTYRFFEPAMDARVKARRALEVDLREAIMSEGFELHYQPVVSLDDNTITSCEALLRWPHPERGMVPPAEFIPIAEETGLIAPLGEWVLKTACAQAMTWPDDIKVAVNVSPVQFKSQTLPLTIIGALAVTGLPARRLVIEITEAVLIRDDAAALAMLNQLRVLGVQIAMDDFGTGYSSLSYLQRFPFDKIKIDRSFIKNIADKDGSPAIVQAVVDIARSRDIATTAEGVETTEQLELLRALGCTEMQGYLFSPPIPAAEISKLFWSQRKKVASAA